MEIPSTESGGKVVLTDQQIQRIMTVHRYREILTGRLPRIRYMTSFTGVAPSGNIGCFTSSYHNMRLAIFGRVLSKEVNGRRMPLVDTIPAPGIERPLKMYFDRVKENVSTTAPVTLDEFPSRYGGRKRREYERAAASLKSYPLTRADAMIKLFLKFEKDVRSDKPGRIPRCILPPSTRMLVDVGRHVAPLEHSIYKAVDQLWGTEVVSKGHNYRGVAAMFRRSWDRFVNPRSLDVDVSKMDQSFCRWIMEVFHDFLASTSTNSEQLREWLGWTLYSKVRGRTDDALFSYEIEGTLSSGMPFTSLAGVMVVTGIIWLFKQHYGIDLTIVDAGDDMTIIFDAKDEDVVVNNVAAWYQQFGLTLECGKVNDRFEGIEFCQSHPCLVEGNWQMVRNTASSAVKDATSLTRLRSPLQAAAWLEACGRGGMASQGGAPIATARFRWMLRTSQALKDGLLRTHRQSVRYEQMVQRSFERGGSYEWYGGGMNNHGIITDAARLSFEAAFGIAPHEQRAIEEVYDRKSTGFSLDRDPESMFQWNIVGK